MPVTSGPVAEPYSRSAATKSPKHQARPTTPHRLDSVSMQTAPSPTSRHQIQSRLRLGSQDRQLTTSRWLRGLRLKAAQGFGGLERPLEAMQRTLSSGLLNSRAAQVSQNDMAFRLKISLIATSLNLPSSPLERPLVLDQRLQSAQTREAVLRLWSLKGLHLRVALASSQAANG